MSSSTASGATPSPEVKWPVNWEVVIKAAEKFEAEKAFLRRLVFSSVKAPEAQQHEALAFWTLALLSSPKTNGGQRVGYGVMTWLTGEDWQTLLKAVTASGPHPTFALVAGKFLSFSGVKTLYNIEDDEVVSRPVVEWLTTLVVNLRMLYRISVSELKLWISRHPSSSETKTPLPPA